MDSKGRGKGIRGSRVSTGPVSNTERKGIGGGGRERTAKAMFFILPSVRFFLKATPAASSLAHSLSRSSTVTQMCPKPL